MLTQEGDKLSDFFRISGFYTHVKATEVRTVVPAAWLIRSICHGDHHFGDCRLSSMSDRLIYEGVNPYTEGRWDKEASDVGTSCFSMPLPTFSTHGTLHTYEATIYENLTE